MRHDTRYDLAAPAAPPGQDPTVYFLTESHRGFCVHYATSLALMGRTLGVPTRLVTGYAGGVRRAGGTEFRASDAHAWVEAFVDGHWEPFDPTPPAAPPAFPWERGAIAVLGGLGGLAVWRFRRRRHPATLEFDRLARRLRRMGVPVSPAMTTREIVSLLAERGLELKAAEVADRFRAYEEARFAAPTRSAM